MTKNEQLKKKVKERLDSIDCDMTRIRQKQEALENDQYRITQVYNTQIAELETQIGKLQAEWNETVKEQDNLYTDEENKSHRRE